MALMLQILTRCFEYRKKRRLPVKATNFYCMNYSRETSMIKKLLSLVALSILTLATACTSVQPPNSLATQARERIKQAESIGADKGAPLALREANQYLSEAENAMQRDRHEEAHRFLEKSLISSELAIARTNSQKAQEAAGQIEKDLDLLRRETIPNSQSNTSYDY